MNTSTAVLRLRATVLGAVQGVGFRPFVHRLATELGMAGFVRNTAEGVVIEVEGPTAALHRFRECLVKDRPAHAVIRGIETALLDPVGYSGFTILDSAGGPLRAFVLPDIATCPECLSEISDRANRRYRYPFTNCTFCGPRYSILLALPYDRANTSMARFVMCPACKAEYDNPEDRRFHAQPNACPDCGPTLHLWNAHGVELYARDEALLAAAQAIRQGLIVAVKGLGGFHLFCDARDDEAVRRLRRRKQREEKPLAVMFPSVSALVQHCLAGALEMGQLTSSAAPIVLLHRSVSSNLAASIAPQNPFLGALLPYTPLHHLLLRELDFPVVATSGNLSDEPICTDEHEALVRLCGIADLFLVHDRPIVRHVDDSIVRVVAGREQVLRRARGLAPLPVHLSHPVPALLALGAHLKNTVALARDDEVFLSQHIGDLETAEAHGAFRRVVADFTALYPSDLAAVACDAHPDYLSSRHAETMDTPVIRVQHHYAHVLACMADNEIGPPCLGVAWDGTGYGEDGTIWGGEFLRVTASGYTRVATLRPFLLPGGEAAIREPRRAALGLLYAFMGDAALTYPTPASEAFTAAEKAVLQTMLHRGLNTPRTTSVGRLFDAVASLTDLCQRNRFEGQAAMALEFSLPNPVPEDGYEITLAPEGTLAVLDWEPLIDAVLADLRSGVSAGRIAGRVHNALAKAIVGVATHIGEERIALSGGCFQNRYLLERTVALLSQSGFRPYWHQRVPPNDGGIALGQVLAAAQKLENRN